MYSGKQKGECVDQDTVDEWKVELAKLCKGLFTIFTILQMRETFK